MKSAAKPKWGIRRAVNKVQVLMGSRLSAEHMEKANLFGAHEEPKKPIGSIHTNFSRSTRTMKNPDGSFTQTIQTFDGQTGTVNDTRQKKFDKHGALIRENKKKAGSRT